MIVEGNKVFAIFIEKLNRFVGKVSCDGKESFVHIPNSGRLAELLRPGARVILRESDNLKRKYRYSLIMVEKDDVLVSVDSILPNKLVVNSIKEKVRVLRDGKTSKLLEHDFIKPEIKHLDSRFDVGLGNGEQISYYLEVKGVTLVENNRARFPDAPTIRGARHLKELSSLCIRGFGAGVFFVVQREDACAFAPNDKMDPNFGAALRFAMNSGVDVFAMKCKVDENHIDLIGEIPIIL